MLWLVHLVIAVLALETLALALLRRHSLSSLAPHLLAGLALLLALRSVLAGDNPGTLCAWLAASGVAHALAVWRITRRSPS